MLETMAFLNEGQYIFFIKGQKWKALDYRLVDGMVMSYSPKRNLKDIMEINYVV